MFKDFFLSEIKYSLKQPMIYIFLGLMTLLTFGITSSGIAFFDTIGNAYINAPHTITVYTTFLTLFGLMIAAAFYNDAALRDHDNNFNEILFSAPISKSGYFFGRFFGALVLATIPMLGIYLGVILGTALAPAFGWVDPERFGSFYLETFINNYFLVILPNMFFAGTIIFAIANKWKSTVISFVGSLVIIIGYLVSGAFISDIDNETIAALTDTLGIRAYGLHSKYFTSIEKNTLSPSFSGLLILNRLIWTVTGIIILTLSYFSFSFREKSTKIKVAKEDKNKTERTFTLPTLNPVYGVKTEWTQFKSFFLINFLNIVKSTSFKILFLFSAIILIASLYGGAEYYGLQSYPLTYKVIDTIRLSTEIFVIIILVFFSGNLIWRDRESKINEVIDATPHTSLISLTTKALALVSVATIIHGFFIICGIFYQLASGFYRIELNIYFLDFFYTSLMTYIVWSGVMIMIQVLLNNKYIGYFISILVVFLWGYLLSIFDVESNMLSIGNLPGMVYSDMNAFGPSLKGVMWFNLYWVLFSFICLLIAGALWNRGAISSLKERIQIAKKQVQKNYRLIILGTTVCWVIVAGFVFYNTQVLNNYKTGGELVQLASDYENKYKKYEDAEYPKISDVKYFIDIFPYKRDVFVKATLTLVNESESIIDSIHYSIDSRWEPEIKIPNSELVLDDKDLEYRIYKLSKPMNPGDKIIIEIKTQYISKGFENGNGNTRIINNGTFLNESRILPLLGYQSRNEISDKSTRKIYGLKPKVGMPVLDSTFSKYRMKNNLSNGTADFINMEAVVSTSGDQIAIAPGSLLKKWKENGRNYYHYKVDHPSQHFYSFMSAKYEVKTRKWNDIAIEVYYDKKHPQNVTMMLDAMERSLDYYTKNFGPYMHKQCRIIEFPRYANFAQAFPGTMPYSEGVGFIINLEDEEENNIVDWVIAHEMAHQWWAHQLVAAKMQGSTMLSESFAEYSSLMTMKSIVKTPMKMRELLKYNHDRYLSGRSNESDKELPLYKVENQMHIHYGKGSIILYALQEYIGEEKVNTAMRNFLEEFKYRKPPYPTTIDFMKHLEPQVPDSLKYIVNDWFKEITLYDNRLLQASYKKLENGRYQITMNIESKKLLADSMGNETPMPLNDWIDVGAFADSGEERLLFVKRVKIDRPEMTFNFEIDTIPAKLAIDPYHLLIDRVYEDNIKTVKETMPINK
jgi:ABC-type transport system involved in multi-copper enzyme maturation permease subunit